MKKPYREGLYKFKGIRYTASKAFIATVNDICEVRPAKREGRTFMACFFMGRVTAFPVDLFEGEWTPLQIDLDGERTS